MTEPVLMNTMEGVEDRNSYPDFMIEVTGGEGGSAILIVGDEKIALYDCGMAYCADHAVENIKRELARLGDRRLDYILLSHSHYDHIGGLPQIKKVYPEAKVAGSAYCAHVFESERAKETIVRMSKAAAKQFGGPDANVDDISAEGMQIDMVLADNEVIDLGGRSIRVIEAPGHTKCSLAFAVEPEKILITSETTGIINTAGGIESQILKTYDGAMDTARRCEEYGATRLFCPHFGMVPEAYTENFWDLFREAANDERDFIEGLLDEQLTLEEMLDRYKDRYYQADREAGQPLAAMLENATATIGMYAKERAAKEHE